jgi:outer membrane protein OmpA-like peptidoglycan-associated protein
MAKIGTYAATAGLCALLALAGCSTVRSARDRIVKPQARCADLTVQIYFEPDSAEVSSEGRAVLKAAAARTKPCGIQAVSVLGLADASGAPQASLELSRRRADAVVQALAATGLPAAEFDTSAAGQAGSLTAAGDTRPLRRRADVTLRVRKP